MKTLNYKTIKRLEGKFILSVFPQVGIIISWDMGSGFEVLSIHTCEMIDYFKSHNVKNIDEARAISSQYIGERYKNYLDKFKAL
tara:strand:- start:6918 stop:7169 length:252 start_codon:yes stop_codon:yes gene_type:complete